MDAGGRATQDAKAEGWGEGADSSPGTPSQPNHIRHNPPSSSSTLPDSNSGPLISTS
jgi:hypothetical protein